MTNKSNPGGGSIDTTIVLNAGLTLRKVEEKHVIGTSDTEYFAILNPLSVASDIVPKGVGLNLDDLKIKIPQAMYEHLMQQRGIRGDACGRVTIELYVKY